MALSGGSDGVVLTLTPRPSSCASTAQRCIQEEMVDAIKRYAREVADLKVWNLCGNMG